MHILVSEYCEYTEQIDTYLVNTNKILDNNIRVPLETQKNIAITNTNEIPHNSRLELPNKTKIEKFVNTWLQ